MARLASLIRVRRHRVDEKQKVLARLYAQLTALEDKARNLQGRLAAEQDLLTAQPELQAYTDFSGYAMRVRMELEDIATESRKLEQRIDLAREELRDSFTELKKIEIIADARDHAAATAFIKKETAMYDDIGLNRSIRRVKE